MKNILKQSGGWNTDGKNKKPFNTKNDCPIFCFGNIAIDCKDALKLRQFYAELLGWESCTMYEAPSLRSEAGLVLLFLQADFDFEKPVWPEQPGQQQKQMHFDFQVDDVPKAVAESQKLGAYLATQQFEGEFWVTLHDPEGHLFCLCQK